MADRKQYDREYKLKSRDRKRLLELKKLHNKRREIVKQEGKILDQVKQFKGGQVGGITLCEVVGRQKANFFGSNPKSPSKVNKIINIIINNMDYKEYNLWLNRPARTINTNLDWKEIDKGMRELRFPLFISVLFIIYLITTMFVNQKYEQI